MRPLEICLLPTQKEEEAGKQCIEEGKVGVLLLAGGSGSRLNADVPKALFPISVVQNKTLLQLVCEKIVAASQLYQSSIPLAIYASKNNVLQLRDYLEKNNRFGLAKEAVFIMEQEELPYLDENKQEMDIRGPDGNGKALFHLIEKSHWLASGIEYANVISIDNPLADPLEPTGIGALARKKLDLLVRAIERKDLTSQTGVLGEQDGKLHIREYSEFSSERDGAIANWKYANIGQYAVSLYGIKNLHSVSLPIHLGYKKIPGTDKKGWKQEYFLFDLLSHVKSSGALCYEAEEIFAPVKDSASVERAKEKMRMRDAKRFEEIYGVAPNREIELDPKFYYLSEEEEASLKRKGLPQEAYVIA